MAALTTTTMVLKTTAQARGMEAQPDSGQKVGIRGQGEDEEGPAQRFNLLDRRAGLKPWEHWVPFSDGSEPKQPRDYFRCRPSSWS